VPYSILVLPNVQRIPLSTMQKLDAYVRKGGTVIATRRAPGLAPGLMQESDTPKIQQLSHQLFDSHTVTAETGLGAALHQALAPDLSAPPEVGFVHRKLDFADIYFLVNTSNHPVRGSATFRTKALAAWWDPFTGAVTLAGNSSLALDLAPYESRVAIFSKEFSNPQPRSAAPAPPPIDVLPPHSWTEDEATRFFSGQKTQETNVVVPQAMLRSGHRIFLNFGEGVSVNVEERRSGSGMRAMLESPVREAAVVFVNGQRAGAVWHPPYEVEVTSLLRAGANAIRIVVANTAINELAKGPLPDYKALNAKYGERFQPQDMNNLQPLPSGLLAPVRLIAR
jgi:hypothetical protein